MNLLKSNPESTVTDWLARGVSRAADLPALDFCGETLSHAELDRLANQIAHYLTQSGVQPGDRVGLCLNRSIEMVAALIGILKAGAAYVPLDPSYPSERLAMMAEDAQLTRLLCHAAHTHLFAEATVWEQVVGEIAAQPSGAPETAPTPESPAYVIFTSGSTGRPKGVAMPHRALANLVEWQLGRKSFKSGARVLQYSSISFDVSFQEIATTLASGGTLFLIGNDERKDPRTLLRQLDTQGIERLFLPYVALHSLAETAQAIDLYPRALRETITAGEQLRLESTLRAFFSQIPDAVLDNQYGPSETHVVTAHLLEGDPSTWPELPPIGTPIAHCTAHILDPTLQPVPDGMEGELYLSGCSLALGYIGRDDLTQKSFIEAPDGTRLYQTGDLVQRNPVGELDFIGRRDRQLKIRGHRVEPGEISIAAATFDGVADSLAHAAGERGTPLRLILYYTVTAGASVNADALRRHLEQRVPDYMVPAFLVELSEFPRAPSGKIDLQALPEPALENSRHANEADALKTETEKAMAEIWSTVLGLANLSRSARFFELGGDSLLAVTLFLKIGKRFGQELPLATLAQIDTVAGLAALIDGNGDESALADYRSLKMIQPGQAGEVPLFLIHGGQGNVLAFSKLARNLGARQPVYAFQWSGWDGLRGESSVPAMAQAYRDELVRFLPDGPLRIGGYCIGGLVAIELVRLLEREGRTILGPLVVFDSPNLHSSHYHRNEPWDSAESIEGFNRMKAGLAATRHAAAAAVPDGMQPDYRPPQGRAHLIRSVPGLMALLRSAKSIVKEVRTIPQRAQIVAARALRRPVSMELRAGSCERVLVRAAKRHRPERFDGDVLYFRSDCGVGRYFALSGWWDDPFLGFAELCGGTFEVHAIGGSHLGVLENPVIGKLATRTFGRSE